MSPSPPVPFASDRFVRPGASVAAWALVSLLVAGAVWLSSRMGNGFPLVALLPVWIIARVAGLRGTQRGTLQVDARGLHWRGRLMVPRDTVVHAAAQGLDVIVRTSRTFRPTRRFRAPDPMAALALPDALGRADERPAVSFRLGSPLSMLPAGLFIFGFLVAVLGSFAAAWVAVEVPSFRVQSALVALAGFLFALAFVLPTRVTLGADGLRLAWLRRRWIRWRDVAWVEDSLMGGGLRLRLRDDGGTVSLPTEAPFALSDADAQADLAGRLHEALGRARAGRQHAVAAVLAQGGRTMSDWVAYLRALGRDQSRGYRAAPVTRDELAEVVCDDAAGEALRAAAAVALAAAGGADEVRRKAGTSASTRLRVALDAAAGAEDPALVEALEEVAASARMSTGT